ncbi:c-type cytochrome [Terrimonas ferruginea]|uniref:c-type cytochrome n=1 Tax=Terrimonas ferruginea TaxID=249 RepID=UPI00040274A9|nr:c-type cytochrome [Terrimonas ferruginea]
MKLTQWKVIGILSLLVIAGVAAGRLDRPARNLKVLPKDISDKALDSLMQTYNKALGVSCSFCHSPHKTIKDSLDYAADDNQMKEEGRKMIRLTISINRDYFYYDRTKHPAYLNVVTCNTCHRGDPYPAGM